MDTIIYPSFPPFLTGFRCLNRKIAERWGKKLYRLFSKLQDNADCIPSPILDWRKRTRRTKEKSSSLFFSQDMFLWNQKRAAAGAAGAAHTRMRPAPTISWHRYGNNTFSLSLRLGAPGAWLFRFRLLSHALVLSLVRSAVVCLHWHSIIINGDIQGLWQAQARYHGK